ncbi:MAG TPA: alpha/beta fold hydrolase, partial [Nitrospirae bacterium]|nr:alpha/beta fold hydrolase [Nitrospirota bacterium]
MPDNINGFLKKVCSFSDNTAIFFEGNEITYGGILANVSIYEAHLKEMGVKHGDVVGIMLPNSPAFIYVLLSVWKTGAIAVPINILLKKDEIKYILEHSKMRAIISKSKFAEMFPEFVIAERIDSVNFFDRAELAKPAVASADGVAVIIYTSGTTDNPKGVMLTHDNLFSNVTSWLEIIKQDSQDTMLIGLPIFHIFGLTLTLLTTFYTGGRCVIMSRFTPEGAIELIQRYKATIFPGVPTMFAQILNLQDVDVSKLISLRFCISGGATMPDEILNAFQKRFKVPILEGYGLTEASPLVAINPHGEQKIGSVGLPVPGIEVKVIDDNKVEVKAGKVGEIVVRGKNIMKGYYKMPDITGKAVQDGWLYTGDLGKMDGVGYLYIVDRKKDLIITGGYNVFPKEVEKVILSNPEVSETAVIGIPDPVKGEIIKAFVVLKEEARCNEEDIIKYCKERIAPFKCPKIVEIVQSLPKNATGKIFKKALRKTHAEYKGIEIRDFSFRSGNNTLAGRLFLPENINYPVPLFVLSCGIGGRKEWFEPVFPLEICKRNIALFTFDLRGHSPSSGKLDGDIISDISAAIEHAAAIKEIDNSLIILGGQCLGGILCNHFAARHPSTIKGVVNISTFLPEPIEGYFSKQVTNSVMEQIRKSETHSANIDNNDFFERFVRHLNVLSDATRISPRPY